MKTRLVSLFACVGVAASLLSAAPARASAPPPGPALRVPAKVLARSLHCAKSFPRHGHKPVLLVHGTTVTDEENWGWNYKPQLTKLGFDVCTVLLPNFALGDVQISSEYAVYAIRAMAHRSHRKIDVIGLSQGPIEPRVAIKWWPDIRNLIDDFVSMAGTNHGAYFGNADCQYSCAPAL